MALSRIRLRATAARRRSNGTIANVELSLGPGVITVGTSHAEKGWVSPRNASIVHQALRVHTDDADARCEAQRPPARRSCRS
jgi:hypothetical protein